MKKVLDITKEHCPMTFVKTKIELSKLHNMMLNLIMFTLLKVTSNTFEMT